MTSCHWKPKYKNGLLKQVVEIAARNVPCILYYLKVHVDVYICRCRWA